MVVGASVLLAVHLCGQLATSNEPAELVAQLGSARFADREAAAGSLEALGERAIPFLQAGRESRDLEIRTRSSAILDRIKGVLLTQATQVRLDFDGAPVPEIVHQLGERTGMRVGLAPLAGTEWTAGRLSLREPGTLPYWQAIDRLCQAANLQWELASADSSGLGEATLKLSQNRHKPNYPTCDSGPFRVCLIDLEYRHRLQFASGPRPAVDVSGLARVQVWAEPRLLLSQSGPLELVEARDDQGRSLHTVVDAAAQNTAGTPYLGTSCGSSVTAEASLTRPDASGHSLAVLRGRLPLKVTARQNNPLIIRLKDAVGRTFTSGELLVTVHEVRVDPSARRREIDLSIHSDHPQRALRGSNPAGELSAARLEPLRNLLDVVDENGRVLPWFQTSVDFEGDRVTLSLSGSEAGEPHELRCYRLNEANVKVPFQFNDIPIP